MPLKQILQNKLGIMQRTVLAMQVTKQFLSLRLDGYVKCLQ